MFWKFHGVERKLSEGLFSLLEQKAALRNFKKISNIVKKMKQNPRSTYAQPIFRVDSGYPNAETITIVVDNNYYVF